ncbi:MAG: hypothetical protein QM539_10315 [Alphaproteobacteria bacterium]|nr:hypothetical protein [Alphaproteobacteria bacterium]
MWTQQTLNQINQHIKDGLNIDTNQNIGCILNSNGRIILSICNCNNYNYNNSRGFSVLIGKKSGTKIQIPMTMLENCYNAACNNNNIYNKTIIENLYPRQVNTHGCYVHVVGMIFYHARLVRQINGGNYILF